jgi:hypothetical protein
MIEERRRWRELSQSMESFIRFQDEPARKPSKDEHGR